MGFAHTVGEFGVVLMVGGNIPNQTRVVSVQIYDHVEAIEYADAHRLAAVMLAFSFTVLLALYVLNPTGRRKVSRMSGRCAGALSKLDYTWLFAGRRPWSCPALASHRCSGTPAPAKPRCCG